MRRSIGDKHAEHQKNTGTLRHELRNDRNRIYKLKPHDLATVNIFICAVLITWPRCNNVDQSYLQCCE